MKESFRIFNRAKSILYGDSLRDRTLSGGAILLIGFGYSNLIRLASNLIMTRLLYPEAFGVMLVINLLTTALGMLSDLGIRGAIISQRDEPDERLLNVAWSMAIMRGFVISVITMLLAAPIAAWYDHSQLFELTLIASLSGLIGGFTSPVPRVAERGVQLGKVTLWQTSAQTLGLVITLTWLFIVPTIWALAANGVIVSIISVVGSFLFFPRRPLKLVWDPVLMKQLFSFGKWVLLGTALTFMGRQGDSVIVSRFFELELLGVFSIAVSFAKLIELLAEKLSWGLLFPVFSEMKLDNPERFAIRTRKLRLMVYAICYPVVMILSLGGRDLINLLYDPRYSNAGWMLEIMALGAGFYVLAATVNSIPLAHGESQRHMWLQLFRTISVLGSTLIGGVFFGGIGLIWGMAIGQIIYYPFLQLGVRKYNIRSYALDLALGLGSVTIAFLVWSMRGWPQPSGTFG